MKTIYKLITAVCLLILVLLVFVWLWARPSQPSSFYDSPQEIPQEHGVLLKHESFTADNLPNNIRAWKILYTTTKNDGSKGVASGVVIVPEKLPEGPRPIVAYAHGTIGVVSGCAPSIVDEEYPNGSARALLDEAIKNGWIFVGTDYIGLGTEGPHPFLIGKGEGYSVLDSIRAAQQIGELQVDDKIIIWGHSQGGHAALWSGILAKEYTPYLNILGVSALSPASDLPNLLERVKNEPIGRFFSAFIARAYSNTYSDIHFNEIVKPTAQLLASDIANRCMSGKKALFSLVETQLIQNSIFTKDQLTGTFEQKLKDNIPDGAIPFPLLIGQGSTDDLVPLEVQDSFVQSKCEAGQNIEYRTYKGKGHLDLLSKDSPLIPDVATWTIDRFENKPFETGCKTIRL